MKPTEKMAGVGIGGVVAMIAMGIADQVGVPIDWTAEVMGVPLGSAVVFAAAWAVGYMVRSTGGAS